MDWTTPAEDQPIWSPADDGSAGLEAPSPTGSMPEAPRSGGSHSALGGLRRTLATAFLAVGLLVVGGVAVVNAADPVGSAAPGATTQPSAGSGNAVTPGGGAPQAPTGGAPNRPAANGGAPSGRAGHDCPNMGGSGTGGSGGSTAPSNPTTPSTTNAPSSSNL